MRPPSGSAAAIESAECPLNVPILEHPLRPPEPDERLEEPSRDRAGEHLGRAEDARRLLGELGQQPIVRGGEALDVLVDARIGDLHQFLPLSMREPPTIASAPSSKRTQALPLPS